MEKIFTTLQKHFPEAELRENALQPVLFIPVEKLKPFMFFLKQNLRFDYLESVSCVDFPEHFEIVYHLQSVLFGYFLTVKTELPKEAPSCKSITEIWKGADWHEREIYDLFGVHFSGHPNLKRIFMPEDWKGYPLRKDYEQFPEYHGMSCLTEKSENGGKTF